MIADKTSTCRLEASLIQEQAEAAAGFADPDLAAFRPNLDALIDSVNEEGALSANGVAAAHQEFVDSLRNRIEGAQWISRHPEIAEERIEAPLILTGLPRSGTTYFQNLFDLDPKLRLLRSWETFRPCPPPAVDAEANARRLAETSAMAEARSEIMPDFNALHLNDADGPDECHLLLTQAFGAAGYHNMMNVPAYWAYMQEQMDLGAVYANHKRQLQLLQWRSPARRWALKYPNHLLAMDVIANLYEDARFLVTHRDPRQTLASICKLTWSFSRARTDQRSKHQVGRQMRTFIRVHIDRLMTFHRSALADRAIHVDYYRVAEAPAEVLAETYDALGMRMAPEVREGIKEWHRRNPKNKRGANDYALEEYGLDADEIADFYSDYISAFDIPSEAEGTGRAAA